MSTTVRDPPLPATPAAGPAAARAPFYGAVPVFDGFERVVDPSLYVPVPDDWAVCLTDVVSSTAAIAAGRYREVNIAGLAAIAAVANALGDQEFPFVFGGDGASIVLPAGELAIAREALAATAAWVRDDLALELRTALVPVAAIRAAGLDVRVARFAASPAVTYAMVSGGGLAWATTRMKAGEFAVPPAAPGVKPDLTGLSCRFSEMPNERGIVLSLIVEPLPGADPGRFAALLREIFVLADLDGAARRPLPGGDALAAWPPKGLGIEARARRRRGGSLFMSRLKLAAETLFAWAIFRFRIRIAGFDPTRYLAEAAANSDFRKFEDALRMTIDCPPAVADGIEARLRAAKAAGIARYGLHRQAAAVVTCFVPSVFAADHVHFVDGASGGYTAAAAALKA